MKKRFFCICVIIFLHMFSCGIGFCFTEEQVVIPSSLHTSQGHIQEISGLLSFFRNLSVDVRIKTDLGKTSDKSGFESRLVWNSTVILLFFLVVLLCWIIILRKNRQQLQKQEKKFRDLFELSQDGVLLRRLDANVFYDCNQAMLDMLGYSEKESFLQVGPKGIVFTKQPDGQMIDDLLEKANRIIEEKKKNRFEGLFKRKDGTPMYAEVVACLVEIDGKPTIQSVVRDMSHRKRMEDELRRLSSAVEVSSAAILITESDGNIEYVNPKFTELTGYSLEEVEGLNPRFLKSGEHDEMFYQTLWQTILAGKEWHGTLLNKKKSGETCWVNASISSVVDENGDIKHFVGVQDDITEMKRLEEELVLAKESADKANRAKSDFLARMSHEIRTPMNAVLGMNHLALKTELSAKQRDYIEKAHGAARSLLGVINDILDFSKIEAGKLEFEKIEFDLEDVFDRLASFVAIGAAEKRLEILFQISPDTPRFLLGDPLRLQQVLTNLVVNAIKFTEQGEVIVSVEPGESKGSEVELNFNVQDTGIGLSEQQINSLFQSFSQADGSTTRKYGGTGLGLAICKKLVEFMGGEIDVQSQVGQGSTFTFSARFERAKSQRKEVAILPPELHGKNVLVVDDSRVVRRVLAAAMEQLSLSVQTAASGEDALLRMKEKEPPFDLVLMDWDMPGIDGIETSKQILAHERYRDVKIIMVTAYGREEIAEQARSAGLKDFLVKPVSSKVLAEAIRLSFGGKVEAGGLGNQGLGVLEKTKSIRGSRVLLVEDNDLNRQVATELLEAAHLNVAHAYNGAQAVEMVNNHPFDLVLMDIQMPVMDGLEATRRIRTTNSQLPIIAMTASAMAADKEKSEKVGMNDHIAKPIEPDLLYETLTKWVGGGLVLIPSQSRRKNGNGGNVIEGVEGIDVELGLRRMGGKSKLYGELLTNFRERYRNTAANLTNLLEKNDFEGAERLAHTFKGLCGSIGATYLQQLTETIEMMIKSRKFGELKEAIAELERTHSQIALSFPKVPAIASDDRVQEVGNLIELAALMYSLAPFIEKRKPKQCTEIMDRIIHLAWPAPVKREIERLNDLLRKYRYKQALPLVTEIVDMCNKAKEDGHESEEKPDNDR